MNWQQLQTVSSDELIAWAEDWPWCKAMADCPQDARWHAEGDVWTHTKMVIGELGNLDGWADLDTRQQSMLRMTALLHDVGKPTTTIVDVKTGCISSPKHALRGEPLARQILRSVGCDVPTRESICALVRAHGRPAFLSERSNPTFEVVRMSWLLDNRLLYLFALADTRGRITKSMDRPEESLHFWKLASEEADCFCQPYPFESAHSRFTYFRHAEPNLFYLPHEDFSCHVTLMCGLPGSGKDYWIDRYRSEVEVVALDQVRKELDIDPAGNQGAVAQRAKEKCKTLLRGGVPFVFNATNTALSTRRRWINLFADYRARIEIVYVEPPMETILKQNRERQKQVPEQVIRRLASRIEPPTWLEYHQLTMGSS